MTFHHFAGNSNSEFQPDRPIGYGAFGVVWSVTDPRDGKRVALKKLPNVFQSLVSSKRVFRELKMMRFFKHENVLCCLDILQVRVEINSLYHVIAVVKYCTDMHGVLQVRVG